MDGCKDTNLKNFKKLELLKSPARKYDSCNKRGLISKRKSQRPTIETQHINDEE